MISPVAEVGCINPYRKYTKGLISGQNQAPISLFLLDYADGKAATAKNPRKWPNLFAFRPGIDGTPQEVFYGHIESPPRYTNGCVVSIA
jgi:hypothetical protein